jgi:hypothetical protein
LETLPCQTILFILRKRKYALLLCNLIYTGWSYFFFENSLFSINSLFLIYHSRTYFSLWMWLHGEGSPVCLNAKPPAVEDRNVAVLIYKPRPLVVFLLSPLLPTTVVPPSLPLNPALPNLSVAFSRPDLSLVASAVPPPPDPPPKSSPSPDPPPTTSPSSVLLPRRRPCPTGLLHHLGGQCRRCPPTT